jgi:phosphatidylserine decarboxylase
MPLKISHRGAIARWLPKDPAIIRRYHHDLLNDVVKKGGYSSAGDIDEKQLSLAILEFKKLIEENAEIFRDFHDMFDQVPSNPEPNQLSITNYVQLLAVLDKTITVAPSFIYTSPLVSGVPMYAILAPFCNTEAGYRAFTNPKVNAMIHKIFDEWARFLVSPASRNVLVTTEGGWFSAEALGVQEQRLGLSFEKAWVSDRDRPHWGFTSWDDFFVRRFREGVRSTVAPDRQELINAPCEAIEYRVATDVEATDTFWLKDMPYSLEHILNYDPLASQLVGGTVYQAILSSLDYHRWHSPIDGRVVKAYTVPGTYYAARTDDIHDDPDVITRSIPFQTAICTRAFIFIESDNPDIGLMCFVGVGLVEVSTTRLEVREGDRIKKGDEIGSFHFGGSTHLLVFRPETKLRLADGPENLEQARELGSVLFYVEN